jgi:hypothetical protein
MNDILHSIYGEYLGVDKDGNLVCGNLARSVPDKGTVSSGTVTFSASIPKQKLTVGGNLTIAYSSWPAAYGEVEIQLVNGGAHTVTWPTINWVVGDGTTSTTFADMNVTLASSGTNHVMVWTWNGGTTLFGRAS